MHWNSVVLKQPVSRLHAHLQATPVDQFQENHDFVEQSACQMPTTVSPTIPSQKLTLKLTWYPRPQIAWGLSRAVRWLLMTLNTTSRVKRFFFPHNSAQTRPSAGCRCHNHWQNCMSEGRSSGNRCALTESLYGCNWSSWSTSRALGWNNPSSRAISRQLFYGSRSTCAIMASSLAGVRTVRGRPAFTSAVDITLLSHGDAAGWRRRQRSPYSRVAAPADC
jgi:hypothetical protein